jgi:hypothetical protein
MVEINPAENDSDHAIVTITTSNDVPSAWMVGPRNEMECTDVEMPSSPTDSTIRARSASSQSGSNSPVRGRTESDTASLSLLNPIASDGVPEVVTTTEENLAVEQDTAPLRNNENDIFNDNESNVHEDDDNDSAQDPETGLFYDIVKAKSEISLASGDDIDKNSHNNRSNPSKQGSRPDPPGADAKALYGHKGDYEVLDMEAENIPFPTELQRNTQNRPGAFREGGLQRTVSSSTMLTEASRDPPARYSSPPIITATLVGNQPEEGLQDALVQVVRPSLGPVEEKVPIFAFAEPLRKGNRWIYASIVTIGLILIIVMMSLFINNDRQPPPEEMPERSSFLRDPDDKPKQLIISGSGVTKGGDSNDMQGNPNEFMEKSRLLSHHVVTWGLSDNCKPATRSPPPTLRMSCDDDNDINVLESKGALCEPLGASTSICIHQRPSYNETGIPGGTVYDDAIQVDDRVLIFFECIGDSDGTAYVEAEEVATTDCQAIDDVDNGVYLSVQYASLGRFCRKSDSYDWEVVANDYGCEQGHDISTLSDRSFCYDSQPCVASNCSTSTDCDVCRATHNEIRVSDAESFYLCSSIPGEGPSLTLMREIAKDVFDPHEFWRLFMRRMRDQEGNNTDKIDGYQNHSLSNTSG